MGLKVYFRSTEMKEWNKRNNIEEWYEGDFCNKVIGIISNIIDVADEYWDSYTEWYDKIITLEFDTDAKLNNETLEKIKDNLEEKLEIDVENIKINN